MNVEEVQRRLWTESRENRENREASLPLFRTNPYDKRVRNLMDLMHNPTWLHEAAIRVLERSRGKAAGVDKMTVSEFEKDFETRIETLRQELKKGTYTPKPLRRVEILKANGKMRPLGIPCLRDKIVQEAMRMALEPIFEVEFHSSSYGFRPNRNAHQAISRCRLLMQKHYTWVIEGDVKACFDEISHEAILKAVREKVMDNKFLELIKRFLKAGVSIKGIVRPTTKGVPQGGVISPLLANAVLNKLDWFLHSKGVYGDSERQLVRYHQKPNVRFVRYADDWCVFIIRGTRQYAEVLKNEIADFLRRQCNLELSPEKTKITHVQDGFDFLGFHLLKGVGRSGKSVAKIRIGQKAIESLKAKLNKEIRNVSQFVSISARIYRTNMVLRGWGEYFRFAHNYPKVANKLDNIVFWMMVKAICRKMDIPTGKCLKQYYHRSTIHYKRMEYLGKLTRLKVLLNVPTPLPYEPGALQIYESDVEEDREAKILKYQEVKRPGTRDLKIAILKRDNSRCRKCGKRVSLRTSSLDHIKPVSSFASFELANYPDNLQTLCWDCHHKKSKQEREKK
ncbi:MAG: group II intron reverse transcriptase/maturase [Thermoguttaceae bacterium]|nr:group II intron reverse transcriptase/maturase [Thermoguttaceae bacterium]